MEKNKCNEGLPWALVVVGQDEEKRWLEVLDGVYCPLIATSISRKLKESKEDVPVFIFAHHLSPVEEEYILSNGAVQESLKRFPGRTLVFDKAGEGTDQKTRVRLGAISTIPSPSR